MSNSQNEVSTSITNRRLATIQTALLCFALAACSGLNIDTGDEEFNSLIAGALESGLSEDHPTIQRLADGVVTYEEYLDGLADEVACYEDNGYEIGRIHIDRINGWGRGVEPAPLSRPWTDSDSEITESCSEDYRSWLELGYAASNPDGDRIEPKLLAHAEHCLQKITPLKGSEESLADLVDTTADKDAVIACLWESHKLLFPDDTMGL